jgi:ribosomal protein L40E
MIKVFEDFDITIVGHYQSILEANGIETFMKNQFGTSGAGELPFVEVIPQLWVLNEADEKRALELIGEMQAAADEKPAEDWVCAECGTQLEAAFTHCWKCFAARLE